MAVEILEEEISKVALMESALLDEVKSITPHAKPFWKYVRCGPGRLKKYRCKICEAGRGHGPYCYGSKRVGDKVRTVYYGRQAPDGVDVTAWRELMGRVKTIRARRERLESRLARGIEVLRGR